MICQANKPLPPQVNLNLFFKDTAVSLSDAHDLGLRLPIFVYAGTLDMFWRAESLEKVAQHLNAKFIRVDNWGHTPAFEDPSGFNEKIEALFHGGS